MAQLKTGQARVPSSNTLRVQFTGVTTATMAAGQLWKFQGESLWYVIASIISSSEIQLTANYGGAKALNTYADYAVVVDYTPNVDLPELSPGDVDIRDVYTRAMRTIDGLLAGHATMAGYTEFVRSLAGEANVTLGIRRLAGQTGDLQRWEDAAAAVYGRVKQDGSLQWDGKAGPHAIGAATDARFQLLLGGAFAGGAGNNTFGMAIRSSLTLTGAFNGYGFEVGPTLIEAGSGVHSEAGAAYIYAAFTGGAATLTDAFSLQLGGFAAPSGTTNASALKILAAPTGGTNNYALWVYAGASRFNGTVYLKGTEVRHDQGVPLAWYDAAGGTTNQAYLALDGANHLSIYTGNTQRMVIFSGGRIGINDTTNDAQVHIKSSGAAVVALLVDTAASPTAVAQEWRLNGTLYGAYSAKAATNIFFVNEVNLGNNVAGPRVEIYRNSNAGAEGPAAGALMLRQANATDKHLWVDAAGDLRIHTAAPTGSSGTPTVADNAGTVVGTQTSLRSLKELLERPVDPAEALSRVLALEPVWFRYRARFHGDEFLGVVIDDGTQPWWSMDAGRSLNEVSLHGHQVLAIQSLHARIATLEAQVAALRNAG